MKSLISAVIVLMVAVGVHATVVMETVLVGDPGNPGDTRYPSGGVASFGGVAYTYNIGKYEVANSQYAEFLNAVATVGDAAGLYKSEMGSGGIGGISRTGSGTAGDPWVYAARPNRGNRPVNFVNWYDTLRFANWMHNGQPTGDQDTSTTEDGAYDMSLGPNVVRKACAQVFLPSEDEWYKAAYYDPNKVGGAGYWDYPTQSDTTPTSELPAGTDLVNGSANYFGDLGYVDTTYWTTEVGAYTAKPSDSAYGTFDQGGNLWEWNEALINGSWRAQRGGGYSGGGLNMSAAVRSYDVTPESGGNLVGFRVAAMLDCNADGILDRFALDCGTPGGPCDVAGCGLSLDCQQNGVPDECDIDPTDPDGNCEVSNDCNSNGVPDECDPDADGDGVPDDCDNCLIVFNTSQTDSDGDGVGDLCDNCPSIPNPGQADANGDGIGDVCPCPDRGDMNDDGFVDGNDIQLFVEKVLGA